VQSTARRPTIHITTQYTTKHKTLTPNTSKLYLVNKNTTDLQKPKLITRKNHSYMCTSLHRTETEQHRTVCDNVVLLPQTLVRYCIARCRTTCLLITSSFVSSPLDHETPWRSIHTLLLPQILLQPLMVATTLLLVVAKAWVRLESVK